MTNDATIKNRIAYGFRIGMLAAGLFAAAAVFAQTDAPSDIPERLAPLAEELGCDTQAACEAAFGAQLATDPARAIELAEQHDAYTPAEATIARSLREQVLTQLTRVSDEDFIEIARRMIVERPALARQFGVTAPRVEAAETIVTAVQNAGANLATCSRPPEELSRDELVACLQAARSIREQSDEQDEIHEYISEERISRTDVADATFGLEEALTRGDYPRLGRTAEEAGAACLRPGSESFTECDEIARTYFGPEGVAELARARRQVTAVQERYRRGSDFTLTIPDGRTITGTAAIRTACEQAFSAGDVALARSCGALAVRTGSATEEDINRSIALLEATRDGGVDFDECRTNPAACESVLPESQRQEVSAMRQIHDIMLEEIGFTPELCEQGRVNVQIGASCLEGSRRALGRIRPLATTPGAQRVVAEIARHVAEGERYVNRTQDLETEIGRGGPGGCRTPEECFRACQDPRYAQQCVTLGVRARIYEGDDAVRRYERYSERIGVSNVLVSEERDVRDIRSDDNFPQVPRRPYEPTGPSPACLAAIRAGDFVGAQRLCEEFSRPPTPGEPRIPIACPAFYPEPCPPGQYRESQRDPNGCFVPGACVAIGQPQPQPGICPALPTVDSCPAGQERYVTYQSEQCGIYYACRTAQACPSGYYRDNTGACVPTGQTQQCPEGQYWNGNTCVGGTCETNLTQTACNQSPGCNWNGTTCTATGGPSASSCPSTWHWVSHAYNYGSCVKDGTSGTWSIANSSCPSGPFTYNQNGWPNGCSSSGPGPGPGTSSCPSSLVALLGDGCHLMYQPDVYCNGPMTQSARPGDTAVTGTCQSPSGTGSGSCPTYGTSAACEANAACDWNASAGTCAWSTTGPCTGFTPETCVSVPGSTCYWNSTPQTPGCSSVAPGTGGAGVPAAPTGLAATAASGGGVQLTWPGPSGANITYYQVWWSPPGTSFTLRTTINVGPSLTSVSHTEMNLGTGTYGFRVKACNASGCSSDSNMATFSASGAGGAPACSDGIDNDGDNLIDHPADTGCTSATDPTETPDGGTSGGCGQYLTAATCPSGCTWSSNACSPSGTGTGQCPSGSHHMGPTTGSQTPSYTDGYCMLDSDTTKCAPLNTTSTNTFATSYCPGGGGTGGGTTCESNSTQTTCTATAGCAWSTTSNYCYYASSGGGCGSYATQASCQGITGCSWGGTYCYASGGGGGTCSQYGTGWHSMDSSGTCFDSNMYNYRAANGSGPYACTGYNTPVYGCTSPSGGTGGTACGAWTSESACTTASGGGVCSWANNACQPVSGGGGTGGTPSAPTNVIASVSGSSVSVIWSAPAGAAPDHYLLYRNGNLLTSVTGTSHTDTSAPAGTSVYYSVQACPTSTTAASQCSPYAVGNSVTAGGGSTSGPACGNGTCESGETSVSCPADCGSTSSCSTPSNCFVESTCTSSGWYWYSSGCWSSPQSSGGGSSGPVCGNGTCESSETSASCPADCGSGAGSGTSCTSGQYWNGSACVSSSGSGCANLTESQCVTPCIWSGSSCGGGSGALPPTQQYARTQYVRHFIAEVRTTFRGLFGWLFGR